MRQADYLLMILLYAGAAALPGMLIARLCRTRAGLPLLGLLVVLIGAPWLVSFHGILVAWEPSPSVRAIQKGLLTGTGSAANAPVIATLFWASTVSMIAFFLLQARRAGLLIALPPTPTVRTIHTILPMVGVVVTAFFLLLPPWRHDVTIRTNGWPTTRERPSERHFLLRPPRAVTDDGPGLGNSEQFHLEVAAWLAPSILAGLTTAFLALMSKPRTPKEMR